MERKTKEKSVESVKSKKQACYQDQKSNMILCLNVVNYQWFDNNSFLAKWPTLNFESRQSIKISRPRNFVLFWKKLLM